MPFQKGNTFGVRRKKGQVTKNRQELLDKAKELGVDPFEVLLRFAKSDWKGLGYESPDHVVGKTQRGEEIIVDRISPELRARCAADAAQFMLPKLKAIEVEDKNEFKPVLVYTTEWGSKEEAADDGDSESGS